MKSVTRVKPFASVALLSFVLIAMSAPHVLADNPQRIDNTAVAIAFMLSILVMKITAFVLGYLIVKLGHDTLIRGISGDIDFGFTGGPVSTKLKSGSPGAFFVLAGAAIIAWALFVEKPFETGSVRTPTRIEKAGAAQPDSTLEAERPELIR